MNHYVLETVPQLSALHFNLAPKPLLISTTGTSCRLQKLNYSEAAGLNEVHWWISASAVSAAVSLGYHGTSFYLMWTSWARDDKCYEKHTILIQGSFNRACTGNEFSCKTVVAFLIITYKCAMLSFQGRVAFEIILCHCLYLLSELIKNPKERMFEATLTSRDSTLCAWRTSVWHLNALNLFSATAREFI